MHMHALVPVLIAIRFLERLGMCARVRLGLGGDHAIFSTRDSTRNTHETLILVGSRAPTKAN